MWFSPSSSDLRSPSWHEIHVWRTHLDLPSGKVQELANILSEDEKARAERFYFEQHRQRFIVGRGILRKILGCYLSVEPQQLEFDYSSRGKPYLVQKYQESGIQFNLSHSQGLALYGFTRDRKIGIDLELIRPMPEAEKIAQRFFSAREYKIISTLPAQEKEKAFFRGWTGKEAYLKATGDGLSGSLDQVEISLIPSEPLHLLSLRGDSQAAAQWSLYSLIPATNYIATVAVEGHDWQLYCWQF